MNAFPLRLGLELSNLNPVSFNLTAGTSYFYPELYLWVVFFKIDGSTTSLDEKFMLQGSATVVGTSGDHGDLGSTDNPYPTLNIPPQLGEFKTPLIPIPTPIPGVSVGGVIGAVAILMVQNGTPDEAVADGHAALNLALQNGLNSLIPTLGIHKQQPTPADIANLSQSVGNSVQSAISDNVSIWQFLGSLGGEDYKFDSAVIQHSYGDLSSLPPTGLALQETYTTLLNTIDGEEQATFELVGTLFADPWGLSLRRFLAEEGLDPAEGIRSPMSAEGTMSLRQWFNTASPTFVP
jgi:hypothetical protein